MSDLNNNDPNPRGVKADEVIRSLIAILVVGGFFAVVFMKTTANESLTMALGGVIGFYFGNNGNNKDKDKKI